MHTTYHPDFDLSAKKIVLTEEESHHLVKVLRHTVGQALEICDGKGNKGEGKILLAHPKKCEVELLTTTSEAPPINRIHLAIAPTKNMDRLEWVIEKATEIGVNQITLLQCKNNERKVVKMERLEKILLAAMKQSKRYFLPTLHGLTPIDNFIKNHPKGGIAHCYQNDSVQVNVGHWKAEGPLLIGPEGDFTRDEVELAKTYAYTTLTLGENRLRTETAAIFGVSILQMLRST